MRPAMSRPVSMHFVVLAAALAVGGIGEQRALAGAPVIQEFERNATTWRAAASCYQPYTFDQFLPGMAGTGCLLDEPLDPVTLQLAGGTVTISAHQGATPYCAISDGSTGPKVSDASLANQLATVKLEFDPPVTAFYTYYGSLAATRTATMKLYSGAVLTGTLVSAASPHSSLATGHGFISDTAVDRIEITTNDTTGTLVGAFVGLVAGEPSLGTNTIAGYAGPAGATVQFDFACQFDAPGVIQNLTRGTLHPCIREAIADAGPGDVIVAPPGGYREQIDFTGKAITVRGSEPGNPNVVQDTIISSEGIDGTVATFDSGEGAGSVLSGFTIQGGIGTNLSGQRRGGGVLIVASSPTITDCRVYDNTAALGGGMWVGNGSNPDVLDCSFEANSATTNGGAVYLDVTSAPAIIDCSFTGNGAAFGGAIDARTSAAVIDGCIFTGNTASTRGGALFANGAWPSVTDCEFTSNAGGNQAGAIACNGPSVAVIHNLTFTNNIAGGTGGAIWGTDTVRFDIDGCTFVNNSAAIAAAAYIPGPSRSGRDDVGGSGDQPHSIRDCRFFGNTAPPVGAGGGGSGTLYIQSTSGAAALADVHQCLFSGNTGVALVVEGGSALVDVTSCTFSNNSRAIHAATAALILMENCLLWDGVVPEITEALEGQVLWTYCNVFGLGGSGGQAPNFDVDPLFADPDGADNVPGTPDDELQLTSASPLVNRGLGVHDPGEPQFDLDGTPRHQGVIDLGAFEFPVDCDESGVADYIEIDSRVLPDCNQNYQFDECESVIDCNANGIMDECDIASGLLHDADGNGFADECEAPEIIAGTITWHAGSNPLILVPEDSTVTGHLTIEEGVRLMFAPAARLIVNSGASLIAIGTAEDPVIFTSPNVDPEASDWGYLSYTPGSSGSLNHAIIEYGQSYGVRVESANVSIEDCLIQYIAGIDQPRATETTPALVGGDAYGIFVTGPVNSTIIGTTIHSIRGGTGGEGATGSSGETGLWGDSGWDTGGHGGNGEQGTDGASGGDGADGGNASGIYCGPGVNASAQNNIVRTITGGAGGKGGVGGEGGDGGDGGVGRSATLSPFSLGGFDGGHGGTSGDGGDGGFGGHGGDATCVHLDNVSAASLIQNLLVDVVGGLGGDGGDGGRQGDGGSGGDGGHASPPLAGGAGGAGVAGGCCECSGETGFGGSGGNAGAGRGFVVATPSSAVVQVQSNTIAGLYQALGGTAGVAGGQGSSGQPGDAGWGWLFLDVVEVGGVPIPIFIPWEGKGGDSFLTICPLCCVGSGAGSPGAPGTIAALWADGSAQVQVGNSVLAGDSSSMSAGALATGSAGISISHSLFHGFQTALSGTVSQGAGVISVDPLFFDPPGGDFHLASDSPAIDAGNNSLVPSGLATDIDGDNRIIDGDDNGSVIVDLGADEFGGVIVPADLNGDGDVDGFDLAILLGQWTGGTAYVPCPPHESADLNADCRVNGFDLALLLGAWGLREE